MNSTVLEVFHFPIYIHFPYTPETRKPKINPPFRNEYNDYKIEEDGKKGYDCDVNFCCFSSLFLFFLMVDKRGGFYF